MHIRRFTMKRNFPFSLRSSNNHPGDVESQHANFHSNFFSLFNVELTSVDRPELQTQRRGISKQLFAIATTTTNKRTKRSETKEKQTKKVPRANSSAVNPNRCSLNWLAFVWQRTHVSVGNLLCKSGTHRNGYSWTRGVSFESLSGIAVAEKAARQ